ncbi:MAG: ATP-binding protein [bacterium]|nr:ATP-binding protein [bacterium]
MSHPLQDACQRKDSLEPGYASLVSFFESLDEATALLDSDGAVLCVNPAGLRLFGVNDLDEWCLHWKDFLAHCGEAEQSIAGLRGAGFLANSACRYEPLGLVVTLKLRPFEWSGGCAYMAVLHDDRATEELNHEYQRQAQFLRQILDTDPNLIYVKDMDGRFVEANRALAVAYGTTAEALRGKSDADFNPVAEDVAAYLDADRRVMRNKEPLFIPEEHIQNTYGEDIFLQTIKIPLIDSDGVARQVLGVSTDITSRKRAEIAMFEAKETAEQASRTKSEFLANMSHEIRTPMNAILGFTEILGSLVLDPKQREYLSSIQSSGKSLMSLINDILDLSKVEAGKLVLEYAPLDLRALLEEVHQIFGQKLLEQNLFFQIEVEETVPRYVSLDEGRLRQILLNLVGNAVKFTEKGGVTLILKSKTKGRSVELDIEVRDTGVGIEPRQKDRIFEAFEQQSGQSSAKFGGTGLGLAITKKLIEVMGGRIQVESDLGLGSRFRVFLPHVEVAQQVHRLERENPQVDPASLLFEPALVLVVDDIFENRQLIQGFLPYPELSLIEASSGAEALELVSHYRPDLILMDLKMPGMSGLEVREVLKKRPDTAQIPVVVVTASVMTDQEILLRQQFDGYLPKPVVRNDLLNCLCRFLNHQISDQEQTSQAPRSGLVGGQFDLQPELAGLLARDYLPRGVQLLEYQTINDIETFAQELIQLARDFEHDHLVDWAEALNDQCNRFDIQGIARLLKELERALGSG